MTEQQKIEQGAISYANQLKQDEKKPNFGDIFTAGASFYREQVMPGMMVEFAEWCAMNYIDEGDHPRVWREFGTNKYSTSAELVTLFLSHLKQKDDGNGG